MKKFVGAALLGLLWWLFGFETAILVLFGVALIDGMIEARREAAAVLRQIGAAFLDWAKGVCEDRVLIVGVWVIQAAFIIGGIKILAWGTEWLSAFDGLWYGAGLVGLWAGTFLVGMLLMLLAIQALVEWQRRRP